MNYGKKEISKKQKEQTSAKVGKKIGFTFVKVLLICFVALIVGGTCIGFGLINGLIKNAPDISGMSVAPTQAATYIYDTDGNPIQKLTAPDSNRTPVTIDKIPIDLQHAVVAVEDERFYEHNGIDVRGIMRAFVVGVSSGNFSEGASTITQQLLKNNVFPDWVNESSLAERFKRKFQEQYLALQLEKSLTKDQILEDYLNTINLGAGAYGVQAAAHRYFNKDVSELTLSESTVIAGITQNPTGYNPILYPEENAKRRVKVLNHMLDQGYIDQTKYDEALNDDVYSRIQETDVETGETSIYTYYEDALIEQAMDDLMEIKGYTQNQAYKALYSGGLKVISNQDKNIQQICDEEFANPANFPSGTLIGLDYELTLESADGEASFYSSDTMREYFEAQDASFNMMFPDSDTANSYAAQYKQAVMKSGDTVLSERISLIPQPQASVVIIDQSTGFVKAIVGGRGTKEASLTLNRATSTRRQPGSTFKPITAYGPAIDRGGMTLATVFDNAPYNYTNGPEVRNWDSDYGYSGLETIRSAITKSVNVVAVKCLTEISPQTGLDYAEKFGITTLYDNDVNSNGDILTDANQPLALGGVRDGVVNLELTGAYAAIANKGQYIEPKFYSKIEDLQGNIVIDNTTPVSSSAVKESTAFLLTSAMEDVIKKPEGTAYGTINLGDMPVAGKSGTTDDTKDIWFEGYTPYYTCGIWGGYDNNEALPDGDIYHSYSKVLWNAIMQRIHQDLPVKEFEQPEDIVTASVCKKSGKLAIPGVCSADPRGSQVYSEYFVRGTEPVADCDVHVAVKICSKTGLKATNTCEAVTKVFVQRPTGSEGTTDDSAYAPPSGTCSGHTILDKLSDLLKGDKDKNKKESETSPDAEDNKPQNPEDANKPSYPGTNPGDTTGEGNGEGTGENNGNGNGTGNGTTTPGDQNNGNGGQTTPSYPGGNSNGDGVIDAPPQ